MKTEALMHWGGQRTSRGSDGRQVPLSRVFHLQYDCWSGAIPVIAAICTATCAQVLVLGTLSVCSGTRSSIFTRSNESDSTWRLMSSSVTTLIDTKRCACNFSLRFRSLSACSVFSRFDTCSIRCAAPASHTTEFHSLTRMYTSMYALLTFFTFRTAQQWSFLSRNIA